MDGDGWKGTWKTLGESPSGSIFICLALDFSVSLSPYLYSLSMPVQILQSSTITYLM